jgi:hypothetical protein
MQMRVMDLVQQVQNDDFTGEPLCDLIEPVSQCCACCNYSDYQYFAVVTVGELLRINDDLLNAFVRYDRFERQRQSQRGGAMPVDGQVPTSTSENAATLVS